MVLYPTPPSSPPPTFTLIDRDDDEQAHASLEGGGRGGSKSAESIRMQIHSGQEAYSENQKSGRTDFELAVSLFNWILQRYKGHRCFPHHVRLEPSLLPSQRYPIQLPRVPLPSTHRRRILGVQSMGILSLPRVRGTAGRVLGSMGK